MTTRYPRNRIASVLLRSGLPGGYRIMPARHAAKPLGTVPADSRFGSRGGGYTETADSETTVLQLPRIDSEFACAADGAIAKRRTPAPGRVRLPPILTIGILSPPNTEPLLHRRRPSPGLTGKPIDKVHEHQAKGLLCRPLR